MTPYVRRFVSDNEVALFERIRKVVSALPDVQLGIDEKGEPVILSCHILVRGMARVFHLKYADGYLRPNFQHSWLLTPEGHVIDVYPVGMLGGPILVDGINQVASRLYEKKSLRRFGRRFSANSFRRSVRRITKVLKQINGQLKILTALTNLNSECGFLYNN